MRLFSLLLFSLVAIFANAQNYSIKGKTLSDDNGKMAYLVELNNMQCVDSCRVTDSYFEFNGCADDQLLFQIMNLDKSGRWKIYVFIEPGSNVFVDLTAEPLKVTDDGGMNDVLSAIDSEVKIKGDILNKRIQVLLGEGKTPNEISDMLAADVDSVLNIYRTAIDANKDNMLGAYILAMVIYRLYPTLDVLDPMIAKVKYANAIAHVRKVRAEIANAAAAQKAPEGGYYVDFAGFDINGTVARLSDYVGRGKYVLVDFWASWCGPCKQEIPNLVELQNIFGGEDFTVLGVNVWDTVDKFRASQNSLKMNYPQIYVPRDNAENATELYGINSIPQIILFAPDGKILRRDLRGAAMKELIKDIMNNIVND